MSQFRFRPVKHIVLALLALLLGVVGVEIGLRVQDSMSQEDSAAEPGERGLITRSWHSYQGLRPLTSVTIRHPDSDQPVLLSTNSFGLRGPEPAIPKPPGVYRVICLGDETVLSAETEHSRTWCQLLAEQLQRRTSLKVEVINAGIPGACPLLSLMHARHALLSLQPDLLVLHVDMSDVADDHRSRRHVRLGTDLKPLACPHPELSRLRPEIRDASCRFLAVRWCRKQLGRATVDRGEARDLRDIDTAEGRYGWLRDDPPDWSIHIAQALAPIEDLSALAEKTFARLIVVTSPTPWQVSKSATTGGTARADVGVGPDAHFTSTRPFDQIRTFCNERMIPCCDLSSVFRRAPQPERLFLQNAARFSEQGHELFSRELSRFLIQSAPANWTPENSPPVENSSPIPLERQASRLPPPATRYTTRRE